MREGMSGADWVIHAAAELDLHSSDEHGGANVEGSENVASLAAAGVGRFLSISSMAAWGGSPADGSPATEESAPQLPLPTRYCSTKAAGEERVQAWARQGLKVNTVFPSLVYGPPGKKQGANTLLRALMLGRFPALIAPEKKTSWIFLDDLVDGIVRVIDQAPPGRGYLLAGEAWTVRGSPTVVALGRYRSQSPGAAPSAHCLSPSASPPCSSGSLAGHRRFRSSSWSSTATGTRRHPCRTELIDPARDRRAWRYPRLPAR
jgi:nucleoside-diphosphate-sugar epimerase